MSKPSVVVMTSECNIGRFLNSLPSSLIHCHETFIHLLAVISIAIQPTARQVLTSIVCSKRTSFERVPPSTCSTIFSILFAHCALTLLPVFGLEAVDVDVGSPISSQRTLSLPLPSEGMLSSSSLTTCDKAL